MKALSLTQPWSSLVAIGAKTIETRSWPTQHRGLLAIHAAKGFPSDAACLCLEEPFQSTLRAAGYIAACQLPRGAVIAIVRLTHCRPTPPAGVPFREFFGGFRLPPPEPEASFGDYGPDRFAWSLKLVERLETPIPARGRLGLWEWAPPSELEAYRKEP